MGLAKLYRVTGDERYLTLAKFLLDERGPDPGAKTNPRGLDYNQAHKRVVEQTDAVGHAVRATYMYSGMADVAALTGDTSYIKAIDAIWDSVVGKKLYLTGGIGATGHGEAFGGDYELPNMTAYNETCAAIGNDYWNHRLFLLHADAKYIDVMERTLYNGLISGVSLDGKSFFYPNPLESNGQHQRSPWFGVACCPGNITRFLASVPGYVYAHQGDTIFVNLFAKGTADIKLEDGRTVKLTQETRYPWDGAVRITVEPDTARPVRVEAAHPGLGAQRGGAERPVSIRGHESRARSRCEVNGQRRCLRLTQGLCRRAARVEERRRRRAGAARCPCDAWSANDRVEADRGRVALAARANRLRRRMAGQPGRQSAQPRAARTTHR